MINYPKMNFMKTHTLVLFFLFKIMVASAQPCITVDSECDGSTNYCGPYELSNGIYRIPFADGTEVTVTNDHFNHCPRGRIDMVGNNGNSIVAAANGWIRFIDDNHSQQCDCSVTFCLNNYVWIEHPNGEWTKYTHMQYHSVPASLEVGDYVLAGTVLGTEGEVGCASGVHLHFEVAQPVDTNTLIIDTDGGYINGNWAKNVIPVFCDITGNVFIDGEDYTAADCSNSCSSSMTNSINVFGVGGYDADIAGSSVTSGGGVTVGAYASVLSQAGDYVTLGVGFSALTNSTLTARIGDCNDFPEKLSVEVQSASAAIWSSETNSFYLFPNPASDVVTIRFMTEGNVERRFTIADVTGRVVHKSTPENGRQDLTVSVSGFSEGIYQCGFYNDHKLIETQLLVIVK